MADVDRDKNKINQLELEPAVESVTNGDINTTSVNIESDQEEEHLQGNDTKIHTISDINISKVKDNNSEEKTLNTSGDFVKKSGGDGERFHLVAHEIFLGIKNRRVAKNNKGEASLIERKRKANKEFVNAIFGLIQIVVDWLIDIMIATFHFYIGSVYVGSLTLGFVFLGGAFVTFSLHVLMRRKGHAEFTNELRKINRVLPYLMYIPSFLPFFSSGLKVSLLNKLRKADESDLAELERLDRLLKITEEHRVTDLLYESSYEAYPQAILQTLILMEKDLFKNLFQYVPLLGVLSAWVGISLSPINMAKSLNNLTVKWTEVVAGMANKGVTLLSFALFVGASRRYFAPEYFAPDSTKVVSTELLLATILSILALAVFSELPGIVSFHLELRIRRKLQGNEGKGNPENGARLADGRDRKKFVRIRADWQTFVNFLSLLIPLTALSYWIVVMHFANETNKIRFALICTLFAVGFLMAFGGLLIHKAVPWLGTFSTDILLLLYIGLYSYRNRIEFRHIDFHYDPTQEKLPRRQKSLEL